MAEQTIIETRSLTKEFKGFVAVKDVSLKIRRGTIHALIGPNGAGKTTCFNLLTHFLTPTSGQIMFNGREITGSRPAAIAGFAATLAVELPYLRKRALEIATTPALDPEMLLLDEPPAGMAHEDVERI